MIVTISTRIRALRRHAEDRRGAIPNVFCSVGTHPHYAHTELDVPVEEIVRLAQHPKVVAIGEAGLDYFYDKSPREAQAQGFRKHIAAAQETGLPLVIHAREADADVAAILEEEMARKPFPAVLHCFTGGPELARRALDLGLYISFSGILTFKKSDALREIAAGVPLDRLLVETDAPYLAPGKYRGKRNEPAYVVETARELARVKGVSEAEIARVTTENFFRLYAKTPRMALAGMSMRFTILGCGSSGGVPRVGNVWGNCDPANPKNRRRRCALLVERFGKQGRTTVLVDTPPDLREQLLAARVEHIDGVLFTHAHADHTHGIDDLRGMFFITKRRIPIYADADTRASLESRFDYCFAQKPGSIYPSILDARRYPSARARAHRRRRRADRSRADPAGARRGALARLPLRRPRLFARHRRHSGGVGGAAAGARCVDRRRAAADAASEPLRREADAAMDRAAGRQAGDPDAHDGRARLRRAAPRAAAPRRAGVRRDDGGDMRGIVETGRAPFVPPTEEGSTVRPRGGVATAPRRS